MRCKTCNGTKQVSSLGHMIKDCHSCGGLGFHSSQSVSQPIINKPLMPLLHAMDDNKTVKYKKHKELDSDHPLNKLKNKIASVNTEY